MEISAAVWSTLGKIRENGGFRELDYFPSVFRSVLRLIHFGCWLSRGNPGNMAGGLITLKDDARAQNT